MVFPAHAALLLRQVMMAPRQVVLQVSRLNTLLKFAEYRVAYTFDDRTSPWASFLYLVIVGCLFSHFPLEDLPRTVMGLQKVLIRLTQVLNLG